MRLDMGQLNPLGVAGVYHKDQSLSVLVVVSLHRAQNVLAANVPDVQLVVLELNALGVEEDHRDGLDDLSELYLEEDGRLSLSIKSKHQYRRLVFSKSRLIILEKYELILFLQSSYLLSLFILDFYPSQTFQ